MMHTKSIILFFVISERIVIMSALQLHVKTPNGQHRISSLTTESTISQLEQELFRLTNIPPGSLKLLHGYPPKPLVHKTSNTHLSEFGFASGDTLIVERSQGSIQGGEDIGHAKTCDALAAAQFGKGVLTRRVVPANNCCLFTSVDFVVNSRRQVELDSAKPMRKLIAKIVSGNADLYNEAFLGKSNSCYCSWIKREDSWGGAIEISLLATYYKVEIDVVDTQSGRIDRFGEDRNYDQRVLLIYDGIHYDPLVMEVLDSTQSSPLLQTVFPRSDDSVLMQAQEIASEAKQSRQYTDVDNFTLRCLICQTPLQGQAQAQNHAQKTGHINFGEI